MSEFAYIKPGTAVPLPRINRVPNPHTGETAVAFVFERESDADKWLAYQAQQGYDKGMQEGSADLRRRLKEVIKDLLGIQLPI